MQETKLLFVDDEPVVIETLKKYFDTVAGYNIYTEKSFYDKESFFTRVKCIMPDLIVLDLILPGLNGLKLCELLKADSELRNVPVIILSGSDTEADKVACLNAGADDYIVKPFSFMELNARINVQLRRQNGKGNIIDIDGIVNIDLEKHEVTNNKVPVNLTSTEFTILAVLASNKGKVMSRDQMLGHLSCGGSGERTIDVHIRHIREKLGETGKLIQNIRSIGYKIS